MSVSGAPELARVLGDVRAQRAGPTVLLIAGIHGNEPAGLLAANAMLELVAHGRLQRGRMVALAGNLSALAAQLRYVSRDLNRLWSAELIAALDSGTQLLDDAETREQRELLSAIRSIVQAAAESGEQTVILDLHSTSGHSAPFAVISDSLESRRLALATPLPLVLGLEETVEGALLELAEQLALPYVLFEGGQHEESSTVRNLLVAVACAAHACGVARLDDLNGIPAQLSRLREATRRLPPLVEIVYRHRVAPQDRFQMLPGFSGFTPVRAGDMLAEDRHGAVTAPVTGQLLLPLYQTRGDDGFFICRRVRRFWLPLSGLLRGRATDRLLAHLPGVTVDPEDSSVLTVDQGIARWFAVELFHLLGYRRLSPRGNALVFRKRPDRTPDSGKRTRQDHASRAP